MQICVLFLYYSYHFKVFLRVSWAHLSFHNARQLLTVGMAIVSCKIGAQSHGYLVSGFSTACRIPIAFGCGITLARRWDGAAEIVKVAGLVAFDGAGVAGAAWKDG